MSLLMEFEILSLPRSRRVSGFESSPSRRQHLGSLGRSGRKTPLVRSPARHLGLRPRYVLPTIHFETSPSTASTHTKCCRGEMFTLQRLKLPPSPYKCLATTNVIESPESGVATPHGERHAVARSGDGGALGRFGLAAQGEELPQNRWPSRSVGVGHDLGPQSLVQPIAGEAGVK
jgi:hypothetical protein